MQRRDSLPHALVPAEVVSVVDRLRHPGIQRVNTSAAAAHARSTELQKQPQARLQMRNDRVLRRSSQARRWDEIVSDVGQRPEVRVEARLGHALERQHRGEQRQPPEQSRILMSGQNSDAPADGAPDRELRERCGGFGCGPECERALQGDSERRTTNLSLRVNVSRWSVARAARRRERSELGHAHRRKRL